MDPDPKILGPRVGAGARQGKGWSGLECCGCRSGGWGEGDVVAEGGELADEVAGLAGRIEVLGVPVGAEVAVAGGGVVHEVPDRDQDGAGDGDQGLEVTSAFDDAAVAGAEEGVGAGRGDGGLAEGSAQPGVAFARGP